MSKTAKDYLKEPYSRILIPVDGTYSAKVLEFHGCFAQGNTPEEAYANLEKAAESWIEVALNQGQEIPPPLASHDYSGRIALRIPRSIHKQAAKFAEMDDTSLNQFFLTAVAARVGAEEFYERLSNRLEAKYMTVATAMSSYIVNLHGPLRFTGPVQMVATQVFSSASPRQTFPFAPGGMQMSVLSGQISEEEALNG